jgi:hypothetical protein
MELGKYASLITSLFASLNLTKFKTLFVKDNHVFPLRLKTSLEYASLITPLFASLNLGTLTNSSGNCVVLRNIINYSVSTTLYASLITLLFASLNLTKFITLFVNDNYVFPLCLKTSLEYASLITSLFASLNGNSSAPYFVCRSARPTNSHFPFPFCLQNEWVNEIRKVRYAQ